MSPTNWHVVAIGQTRAGDSYEWSGAVSASSMHVACSRGAEMLENHARIDRKAKKKPNASLEWCQVTAERDA